MNEVLEKIKKIISIAKFDDIKIVIDKEEHLPNYIILKDVVILLLIILLLHKTIDLRKTIE